MGFYVMLGVADAKPAKTTSTPRYRITKGYRTKSGDIGKTSQTLTVTVDQAGKDAAWALELADRYEFHEWNDDWLLVSTTIEQI
jgi:hypothetical protein